MAFAAGKIGLIIHLNESQPGYLVYRFPKLDPEDAIVKLLECDRMRTHRKTDGSVNIYD